MKHHWPPCRPARPEHISCDACLPASTEPGRKNLLFPSGQFWVLLSRLAVTLVRSRNYSRLYLWTRELSVSGSSRNLQPLPSNSFPSVLGWRRRDPHISPSPQLQKPAATEGQRQTALTGAWQADGAGRPQDWGARERTGWGAVCSTLSLTQAFSFLFLYI